MKAFFINCKTREEVIKVLGKMEERGIRFGSGRKPTTTSMPEDGVKLLVNMGVLELFALDEIPAICRKLYIKEVSVNDYLNSFIKKDLRAGQVIETRLGKKQIVMLTENGDYFFIGDDGAFSEAYNYNDYLIHNIFDELDIVKVFTPMSCNTLNNMELKLIWERKDNKIKEISVKEATNLLKEKFPDYSEIKIKM